MANDGMAAIIIEPTARIGLGLFCDPWRPFSSMLPGQNLQTYSCLRTARS